MPADPPRPDPLSALLAAQGFVILDGGLATELERRGANLTGSLWSARVLLERPELIRDVHLAYFEAGADVAITASYQASVPGFVRTGRSKALARHAIGQSVMLAREAGERFQAGRSPGRFSPLVAGSVGPYGAALADGSEYRGGYQVSNAELLDFHGPRLEALISAGADLIAIETCPSPREAAVVLELLATWPGTLAWVSFTARDGGHVGEGQPVAEAISAVAGHPQVVAVGFNCVPPALADDLVDAARQVTTKPLVIYPNSGERWDESRRAWIGELSGNGPADIDPRRWYDAGARLIGGCCRTTPTTIRRIRAALASRTGARTS